MTNPDRRLPAWARWLDLLILIALFVAVLAELSGGISSFDASLGFNRSVYPVLYSLLLPFRGLRVPARFSVPVGLSLAILAGVGVARLMRRLSREGGALLAATLIGLVFLEYRRRSLFMPSGVTCALSMLR